MSCRLFPSVLFHLSAVSFIFQSVWVQVIVSVTLLQKLKDSRSYVITDLQFSTDNHKLEVVSFRMWYDLKTYLDLNLFFREFLLLFGFLPLSSLFLSAFPLLFLSLPLLFQLSPSPLLSFFLSYSLELKRIMYIQYKTAVKNMPSDGAHWALTCFSNFLFLMYSNKGVVLLATKKSHRGNI